MIQRIQTLYLFGISTLIGCAIFLPLVQMTNSIAFSSYQLNAIGLWQRVPENTSSILISNNWLLCSLLTASLILAVYSIFLYKNRLKQIRLCVINFVFFLLFYITLFVDVFYSSKELNTNWTLSLASLFPLIAAILNYLTIGAIGKDEALVKSMDRLR
jgi:hypothetical protein